MRRTVATGIQNFVELRSNNCFYVDKTGFISDWWNRRDAVTLITRPRRFGKTLMLDTVRTFFSPEFSDQKDVFDDLAVSRDEALVCLQGTVPVIFISFADVKETTYREAVASIKEVISNIYLYFKRILYTDDLDESDKRLFSKVHDDMDDQTVKRSIRNLAEYITFRYRQKPIILLDEYDTPVHDAWIHGYWDDIVDFMRGFFNSTFKTNPYMSRGLITGITRVSKESIFSDMNNIKVSGITSKLYDDCFGFTEREVFAAMDEFGLTNKNEVKEWYDGFIFGDQKDIYNPLSITEFLSTRELDTYWKDTSSNRLVGDLIRYGDETVKKDMAKLLEGTSITTRLDEQIVFSQVYTKEGAVWSLLMASGYVKPVSFTRYPPDYELALTNFETRIIFEDLISGWFSPVRTSKQQFLMALLHDDNDGMNTFMKDIVRNVFSYFDIRNEKTDDITPGNRNPESFYHAFVLGLMIDLHEQYQITSNRESGYGRYDVMLSPRQPGDHAIVIECKSCTTRGEKNLEKTCAGAVQQIVDGYYISQLTAQGVPVGNIYIYGFAFRGKEVLICGGAYTDDRD